MKAFRTHVLLVLGLAALSSCTTPREKAADSSRHSLERHVNGSQPVAIRQIIIDIPKGQILGTHHVGAIGGMPVAYAWKPGGIIMAPEFFLAAANDELRRCGFDLAGDEARSVAGGQADRAPYLLDATIKSITWNTFATFDGYFAEATVGAIWKLQDSASRQTILACTNSGYARQPGLANAGIPLAFSDALERMIASSRLVDLIATNGSFYVAATDVDGPVPAGVPISIATLHYDPPHALPENFGDVAQGIVTVKAGKAAGCGAIISPDGYVLTAAHLVSGKKKSVIRFNAGLQLEATVVRVDQKLDLALLKLPGTGYPALELNLAAPGPAGEEVYAVGSPTRDSAFTVTKETISAHRQRAGDDTQFIQTDVALNPGNNSGLLLDQSGNLVGIVSRKIVIRGFERWSFGVPVDAVAKRLGIFWK